MRAQRWARTGSALLAPRRAAVALAAGAAFAARPASHLGCASAPPAKPQTVEDVRTSQKAQAWVELNADKTKSCLVNTDTQEWIETAAKGVGRKLIERLGGEVARATTIVRFEPGMSFPAHTHGGGEEFLVLEGAWYDEWATQPKHTYVRNYIGSRHQPRIGEQGCTILVKLRQMAHEHQEPDHTQWDWSPESSAWQPSGIAGCERLKVYCSPFEEVYFERWAPGTEAEVRVQPKGCETFVIEGGFVDELGDHRKWSWAREAEGGVRRLRRVGKEGCVTYVKAGHLESPEVAV